MIEMSDEIIVTAEKFARAAHDGQVDKLGVPYIKHVEAVVALCREFWPSDNFKPHGIAVAWLHDVLEDSDMVLESLAMWFPRSITKAVDAITHRPNEPRSLYYSRVKANYIAHNVKILDVKHNQSRLHLIEDSETRDRLTLKYLAAEIALETS